MKSAILGICLGVLVAVGFGLSPLQAQEQPAWPTLDENRSQPAASTAPAAAETASRAAYNYLFFHGELDQPTQAAWTIFQAALQKSGGRAQGQAVNIADPNAAAWVTQYNLANTRLPVVLAFAANGALMATFSSQFTEDQLLTAFGTRAQEEATKALQSQKMVLLAVQNEQTRMNTESMTGVYAFKRDPQFDRYTEVVVVNPSDPSESAFLQRMGVDPRTDTATTVFLTPPGVTLGVFTGALDKEGLIAHLKVGGCGPHCQCLKEPGAQTDAGGVLKKFWGKIATSFAAGPK